VSLTHAASRRRFVFLCGIAPVLVLAVFGVFRPAFLARLDDSVYDILLRSARTRAPRPNVAIIDVDERSLSALGQWPWRRDVVARLIARLRSEGASVIALDIVFAESDRNGPAADRALADVLREGRVIPGYGLTFDPAPSPHSACMLHPVGLAIMRPPDEPSHEPLFHATGAVCNLPMLDESVAASGFLNAAPDADGILRRVPLLVELDGRVYPSLALAAVTAATGAHDMALRIANVNAAVFTLDDRTVPVDGRGNLLLRYRGKKRTFPYFSAADVLAQQLPADALRGKIVFVGTTALGTREVVATPLDTLFAGVEVQATVADNLLQQDFIRRSALGATLESLLALALGVAMTAVVARIGVSLGLAGAVAGIAALWWGAVWLLSSRGVFISPLFPTAGMLGAVAAVTIAKVTVERRRADTASRDKTAAQRFMVQALLSLTEVRDAETGRHSRRTQQYARLLAEQLATQPEFRAYLTRERIDLLSSLAPLHDIGKVGVPDQVLNKPGALTPAEQVEMRKHPALGRDVILKAEARVGVRDDATLEMAKDIVYTHHERWDGGGYPQGLRGTAIPVAGRVMAVVDVYDAVHARALYRESRSHDDTVAFIVSGKGTHFDPAVVEAFLCVEARFKATSEEPTPV
jgi:adenylate cyclase